MIEGISFFDSLSGHHPIYPCQNDPLLDQSEGRGFSSCPEVACAYRLGLLLAHHYLVVLAYGPP
jgi:hypothetical protein